VLYFHGGGWVGGSVDLSDGLCRRLALASGATVFSVDYRLAPEDPFPAAVEDADAALAWLLGLPGIERIVLAGDSAGGTLATVATRHAVERGEAGRIVLEVLVYPATDHAMDTASYLRNTEGLILNAGDMRKFWDLYLPDLELRADPDASPLRAESLDGMPPTFFLIAEFDPLRDEGMAYANRLREAGVDVVVDEYDGLIHGFFPLAGMLSAADRAVDAVGAMIAAATVGDA
jgi:acetyl esterase